MSVPGPVLGPCTSWIDGGDVMACCGTAECDNPSIFDTVALEASMALYEISGRQFAGVCERTVRPCGDKCGCWGGPSSGLGPWAWSAAAWGVGVGGGWWWRNECGDHCGCGSLSRVKLAGYPVREILEVKVGGDVVDPATYRLDGWRWLTRLDDAGPPVVTRTWPACQNLALDDTEDGTFSVTYEWGVDPPELGRAAAAQLACQLFLACTGGVCDLPSGVTRVVRQGVEIERGILSDWFDPAKATGMPALDTFLRAYWGTRAGRRPAVFSPDVQQYARRLGV